MFQRYGRLTVVREARKRKGGRRRVLVRCDCGTEKTVEFRTLIASGRLSVRSCGCLRSERIQQLNRTHGMKGVRKQHPLYLVWRGIKTRCLNPKNHAFKNYGAKGIKIASEWANDPVAFVQWGIENGWTQRLTIHRKNSAGDYEPSNCEFISKSENSKKLHQSNRCQKRASFAVAALSLPG